jgi:hypothetical protein
MMEAVVVVKTAYHLTDRTVLLEEVAEVLQPSGSESTFVRQNLVQGNLEKPFNSLGPDRGRARKR